MMTLRSPETEVQKFAEFFQKNCEVDLPLDWQLVQILECVWYADATTLASTDLSQGTVDMLKILDIPHNIK